MKACYIHVPFCRDICSYCDFTRCRYHAGLCDKWLFRVHQELDEKLQGTCLETVYIGGGTPSALSEEQLEQLLSYVAPYTNTLQEYTIEANVESLSDRKLEIMKSYGVNRISLGVQTLQPRLLECIRRAHSREDVLYKLDRIHSYGIHNVSIDLIYGLPGQTMEEWEKDVLDIVTNFDIQHISLYSLTIEEHSEFGRNHVQSADETLEADMFECAIQILEEHGFEHYEISNFSKEGKRSKHNQIYWNYEDFVGIGCGASGKCEHRRYDNTKNLQTYFDYGESPTYIELGKEDEMFETLMMGLRMKDGVSLSKFEHRFHEDIGKYYKGAVDKHVKAGLLIFSDGYLKTSKQGMLLLNDILVDFLN